jgi:hypothetical protein
MSQGFTGGTLGCTGSCTFDTSGCTGIDPDGTYTISPIVNYSCAFGIVNFTIDRASFNDNGVSLSVAVTPDGPGGGCAVMNGDTASDGMFTVSCVYPGDCTETYTLTGTFATPDIWSGTYVADFTGTCFGCTRQMWSVTGTRI